MNQTSSPCCKETENYQSFASAVWIYGSPTLVILGTIGNVLVAIVMQQKQQRKYTVSFYLTYLAFLDTMILYTGLSRQWILARDGRDIRNESQAVCKLHLFLMYYLVQVEAWLLTCISMERAGAVWVPTKTKHIFTRRFAIIQVAVLSGLLFIADAHLFWTQALIPEEAGNVCRINPDYFIFRINIWGWIDMSLASIMPFSTMITCNIAVIIKIGQQQHQRKKRNSSQESKVQSVTIMLLTVCIVFLLFTFPATIYLSDTDNFDRVYGCCYSYYVIWPMLNMLFYLNNTVNFLLYCVSGRKFRQQLRAMFLCRSNVVGSHGRGDTTLATADRY